MYRSILIVFAFSLSSFADTHPAKRFYPALSLAVGFGCKAIIPGDTAVKTFCDKLILSGMFAAGDEIAGVVGELTNSTEIGHAASAGILFVTGFDYKNIDPLSEKIVEKRPPLIRRQEFYQTCAQYSRASATNQVGHVYRDLIRNNTEEVQIDYKVVGASLVLAPWLATYALVKDPSRFAMKAGVGFSFTSAYMLRESALEVLKSHKIQNPELKVAVVFTGVGATGLALQAPFTFPYFVSMAIFDAGAFSFADEAVNTAQAYGLTVWTAKILCAFLGGAALYIPDPRTTTTRIVSGFATAFFYPAAFSLTYEAAQDLWSYLVDKGLKVVERKPDL